MKAGRLPVAGHQASLILALVFGVLAISMYSPLMPWVLVLALCAVMVRVALFLGWYNRAPSSRTVNLLAVLSAVTLAWFSQNLGFLLSMVNLLVMACALKLMLLSRRRDFLQLFISGLFLTSCGYIFTQSIGSAMFYLALLIALLMAQFSAYSPGLSLKAQSKQLFTLCAQAAPIALILFLLLPQLPPLWKMPAGKSNSTGLTDKVTPGDIAQLSRSSDLVFNATFEGSLPTTEERYWRALTLEYFDGASWEVSPLRRHSREKLQWMGMELVPQVTGRSYNYQVIAEPTGQNWLYAMDVAIAGDPLSQSAIWQSSDYSLLAQQPVMSKWAYQVSSYPDVPLNQASIELDQNINLQVPPSGNPRTVDWVNKLQRQYPQDRAFIQALMNHFAQDGFRYTLTPPPMPVAPVDAFLFEHQAGFCAHYASAMAYALRLAGIPARMVAGYQGGEPLTDKVLSVYQYDAHAWVEAHLGDAGWVRFDPTSVVAPSRLRFGLEQAMAENGEQLTLSAFDRLRNSALLEDLRHVMANLDYLWSRWILGFNASRQQDLLEWLLGQVTPQRLTLLFLGMFAVIAGLLALYFLPRWRTVRQPAHRKLLDQAEALISQYTGQHRNSQAVGRYCERVRDALPPHAADNLALLCQQFEVIEYAPHTVQKPSLTAMKQSLRNLARSLKASYTRTGA